MRAMVFEKAGEPLRSADLPVPEPMGGEVRLAVEACAVCRTDLHIVEGDLDDPALPLVPGHQIVGVVDRVGDGVEGLEPGQRLGVPWLGATCGQCGFCRGGSENLCPEAAFTGYHRNGGFAEYVVADSRFCFPIPLEYPAVQAAPLLCAGLIGYRSLRMAGDGESIGLYGFGAAAHILSQVLRYQGRRFCAFTRPGDSEGQRRAAGLGAVWAGGSDEPAPGPLDAALLFAPVGSLVPKALRDVRPGGIVVCAGIHMSEIPAFPYEILWGERQIRSVANLTRRDGEEFLDLAPRIPIRTEVETFPLEQANRALDDLRAGRLAGSAVLQIR
jgi:propanol-preferring alcohol dehydrogenase